MAFEEFTGQLDAPAGGGGFAPFSGELDAPAKVTAKPAREVDYGNPQGFGASEIVDMPVKAGGMGSVLESRAADRPEEPLTLEQLRALEKRPVPRPGEQTAEPIVGKTIPVNREGTLGRAGSLVGAQLDSYSAGFGYKLGDAASAVGADAVAKDLRGRASNLQGRADQTNKSVSLSADGAFEKYAPQILAVFPTMAVAGMTGAVIPAMFGIAEVQAYAEGRKAGMEPGMALARAVPIAAAEAIGEKLGGTGKLIAALEKAVVKGGTLDSLKELSGRMAAAGMREVPSEEATYAMQFGIDKAPGIGLKPNAGMADFLEGAKDTAIVAAGAGGMMAGGGMALNRLAAREKAFAEKYPTEPGMLPGVPPAPVDPVAAIAKAQTVDEAIAAAQAAVRSSTAVDNIGEILKQNLPPAQSTPAPEAIQNVAGLTPDIAQTTQAIAELEAADVRPSPGVPVVSAAPAGPGLPEPGVSLETGLGVGAVAGPAVEPGSVRVEPAGDFVPLEPGAQLDAVDPRLIPVSQRVANVQDQTAPGPAAQGQAAPAQTPEARTVAGSQSAAAGTAPGDATVQAAGLSAREVAIASEKARIEAKRVERAERAAAKAQASAAPAGLSVGMMPNTAEPVTVKDGVVYSGKYPASNFDTGADVTVDVNATLEQIRDALVQSGALGKKARVFGVSNKTPAIDSRALPATDFIATETPDPVQQRADFAASEKARKVPGNAARTRANAENPFKAFLGKHGISNSLAAEFAPGRKGRQASMVQGYGPIFRKSGPKLDALAARAVEEGFLLKPDEAKLQAMIADALRGKRIIPQYAQGVAEDEGMARVMRNAELEQQNAEAQNAEVEAENQAERAAIQAVADLPDADIEFLANDDVVLTESNNVSEADFLRALGATEQEIEDAVTRQNQGQGRTRQGDQGITGAEETAAGAAPGNPQGRNGQAGDSEGLTSPTSADVLAQQDRKDNAEALDQRQQIDREASGQSLTSQTAPEQRTDTSGDMFAAESGAATQSELGNLSRAQQAAGEEFSDATPEAHRTEAARISKVAAGLTKFPDIKRRYEDLAESHILAADRKERGGASLFTTLNSKSGFANTKFDKGPATAQQAMADAVEVLGFDPKLTVLQESRPDMPNTPMRYDLQQGVILYNTAVERKRAANTEYMIEEILHALDHVGGQNTLSASNPAFAPGGELRSELEAARAKSAAMRDVLVHPLDGDYTDSVVAAELFARSGMLYFSNPNLLRLTAPKTYEKFVSTFGLRDGQSFVQSGVRRDAAGRSGQVSNDSRSQRPATAGPGNAASGGKQSADGLQRLRESVLQEFGGRPAGKRVDFGSSGSSLKAATPAERATNILDAADIKGKDRLEALRDVRAGLITPEELATAYPATVEQTETAAFKKWFGDSKVVDADGKPLRMYHGTTADFDEFEREGLGAHFTADRSLASGFAEWKPEGGNVMPAYLAVRNPLRVKDHGGNHADARNVAESFVEQGVLPAGYLDDAFYARLMQDGALGNSEKFEQNNAKELTRIRKLIKAKGYDGLVYENTAEGGGDAWVPFSPEQIKSSTGNRGTFDPADSRIQFSRGTQTEEANALEAISQNDDLFALPKSEATTVEEITTENDPAIKVKKTRDATGRTDYKITLPNGKIASLIIRRFNPYATPEVPTVYGYDLRDGEMENLVLERPGTNPEDVEAVDDVWIDASSLDSGGFGAVLYNIAATYAKNTGRKFIGDPAGLSDDALRRRTEQMLSSALKFGTTEHLAPHPRQVRGDKSLGVPPLQWTYGDDLGNIRALVETSLANYSDVNPVTFEPSTGRFLDSEGVELDDDAISLVAAAGPGRESGAGVTTLKRNAVLSALVREEGGRGSEGGRRDGLLERLLVLAGQSPASTSKLFYSEGGTPAVRNPSTVESVQSAVAELIGGKQLPNKLGRVVATTASEIKSYWEPQIGQNVQLGSEGDAGQVQAFFDPRTKTVFLIADNIPAGDEMAVAAHELMHKHGRAVLGKDGWDKLHGVINSWANFPEDSDERAVYTYASARAAAAGKTRVQQMRAQAEKNSEVAPTKAQEDAARGKLSGQEMFPYAVEAAIKMGIKPSLIAKKGTVARWLGSVKYAMQQAWSKVTGRPETFKMQDLVDLAFGIAQRENPEHAGAIKGAIRELDNPHKDWNTSPDALRKMLRSPGYSQRTLAPIMRDVDAAQRVRNELEGFQAEFPGTGAVVTDQGLLSIRDNAGPLSPAFIEAAKDFAQARGLTVVVRHSALSGAAYEVSRLKEGGFTAYTAPTENTASFLGNTWGGKASIAYFWAPDGSGVDDATPMFSRTATQTGTPSAPSAPALNPWRDETGRMQFAPGAWLYDQIGKAASPMLVRLGMKAATPELRRQLRQMKIDVEKAQEVAVAIARETTKLSEAERAMVSDLVEQELKVGVIPPAHAVKLAAMINDAMGRQTDELVSLGMLTKDSADKWRGKYLPRYYGSKLKDKLAKTGATWADALMGLTGRQSVMKGIKGKNLKGRGLYETIPEAELPNYEALGWEVRDPDYQPSLPSVDGTVQVWRDFSPAEREKMGEIRDAGFRFVMGYMQTQRDIALGRMFERMAQDPESSSRLEKEGYVQVPTTTVSGTGVKVYGKLAGRWVPTETMSQLSNIEESTSAAWQMYRKALGWWKQGKTSLNPVAHVNNIVSNLTMAHLAGVSYLRGDKYIAAARDFVKKTGYIQEAKDNGLFLGTISDTELMNSMPEELRLLAQKQESTTLKVARTGFDIMTMFLRKPMGAAYQAEDTFFRYLIYKDARDRGTEPQDAVDYAQRYIFTYDDLPKGARRIRDFGIPFFSYTYKAVPALLHTALTHPLRMAAPAAVLWGINAAAYAIATGDDDDDWQDSLKKYITDPEFRAKAREQEKLEREHLPPWNKGTTSMLTPKMIRLGMDEVTKLPLFIDVSRIIPGGDLFDVSPNAGGIPLPQPITPSHPLFTTAVAMLGNKDLFRGKDLVDKNDTRGEAAEKRAEWLWTQLAPAIAAGSYHWERGMNALAQATGKEVTWMPDVLGGDATGIGRDGLPVQPKYAAMQTFGIKVRPMDLDTSAAIDKNMQNKLLRDIDAEMSALRRLERKGAVSPRTVDKARELADMKKDRIKQGLTVDGSERD